MRPTDDLLSLLDLLLQEATTPWVRDEALTRIVRDHGDTLAVVADWSAEQTGVPPRWQRLTEDAVRRQALAPERRQEVPGEWLGIDHGTEPASVAALRTRS